MRTSPAYHRIVVATILTLAACGGSADENRPEATGDPKSEAAAPGSFGPSTSSGSQYDKVGQACSSEGQTQQCFAGDSKNAGVGSCTWGTQTCIAKGEFAQWGPCVGSGAPDANGECTTPAAPTTDDNANTNAPPTTEENPKTETPSPPPSSPPPSGSAFPGGLPGCYAGAPKGTPCNAVGTLDGTCQPCRGGEICVPPNNAAAATWFSDNCS